MTPIVWPITLSLNAMCLANAPTSTPLLQHCRLATAAQACGGDRAATVGRCLELDNLALTAEAIALAALSRTESRGTHYREDYPESNDTDWRCNLLLTQSTDGRLQARKVPVVTA